jgi:hypothetical protein
VAFGLAFVAVLVLEVVVTLGFALAVILVAFVAGDFLAVVFRAAGFAAEVFFAVLLVVRALVDAREVVRELCDEETLLVDFLVVAFLAAAVDRAEEAVIFFRVGALAAVLRLDVTFFGAAFFVAVFLAVVLAVVALRLLAAVVERLLFDVERLDDDARLLAARFVLGAVTFFAVAVFFWTADLAALLALVFRVAGLTVFLAVVRALEAAVFFDLAVGLVCLVRRVVGMKYPSGFSDFIYKRRKRKGAPGSARVLW